MKMRHIDFWSNLITSSQDAALIAHAEAEYYRSLATKTSNLCNSFALYMDGTDVDNDDLEKFLFLNSVPYYTEEDILSDSLGSKQLVCCLKDNPSLFNIANSSEYFDEVGQQNKLIPITDAWGNTLYYDMDDLSDAIGFQIDQTDIIASGYEAIDKSNTDIFFAKMNATYKEVSDSITSLIDIMGTNLNVANISISEKLKVMDSITSMDIVDQISTTPTLTPGDILNGSYNGTINKYTGSNPVVSMFNGINFNWSSVGDVAKGVFTVCYVLPFKATIAMAKGIGKAFSWLGNLFKKTFIDPTDYKISHGNSIGYTKNSSVFKFSIDPEVTSLYNAAVDTCPLGEYVWLTIGLVAYRIYHIEPGKFIVESWTKPLSPTGLRQLFHKTGLVNISDITYQQLYDIISGIQNIEALDKGTAEAEVYHATLISQTMSDLLLPIIRCAGIMYTQADDVMEWCNSEFETNTSILAYIANNRDYVLGPETYINWNSIKRNADGTASQNLIGGDCHYDLLGQLRFIGVILNEYTGPSKGSYETLRATNITAARSSSRCKSDKIGNTITNTDFWWAFSLDPFGHAYGLSPVNSEFDGDAGEKDSDGIYSYTMVNGGVYVRNARGSLVPNFLAYIITIPYQRKLLINTKYQDQGKILLGYSSAGVAIDQNLEIKTDADNATAVATAIVGALVLAATIVGVAKLGKYRDKMVLKAFTLNQNTNNAKKRLTALMNLPTATNEQRMSAARQYRKALAKQNLFAKFKGSYGFTSAMGAAKSSSTLGGISLTDNQEVISLIKQM